MTPNDMFNTLVEDLVSIAYLADMKSEDGMQQMRYRMHEKVSDYRASIESPLKAEADKLCDELNEALALLGDVVRLDTCPPNLTARIKQFMPPFGEPYLPLKAEIERLREALGKMKRDCEISMHFCDICGKVTTMAEFDIYSDICRALAASPTEQEKQP